MQSCIQCFNIAARKNEQGRNFGLKSWSTNSEGEWSALGSRGETREERRMGRNTPPHPTLGSGRASSALPAGPGTQPRLLLKTNSSPFCPEKWGVLYPSVQKWGYRYLSYSHKLRLWERASLQHRHSAFLGNLWEPPARLLTREPWKMSVNSRHW